MRSTRRAISAAARREKVSSSMRPGIGAVDDEVGDAVGKGVGLAGAGAGDDEKRAGHVRTPASDAVLGGTALLGIEAVEMVYCRHEERPEPRGSRHPDHNSFACAKLDPEALPRRTPAERSNRTAKQIIVVDPTRKLILRPGTPLGASCE